MRMRTLVIVACTLLSACSANMAAFHKHQQLLNNINHYSPTKLRQVDKTVLCSAYASQQSALIKNELNRRHLLSSADWQLIKQQKLRVGMSECALLAACSKGAACLLSKHHVTHNLKGKKVTLNVYHCGDATAATKNGKVVRIYHRVANHSMLPLSKL